MGAAGARSRRVDLNGRLFVGVGRFTTERWKPPRYDEGYDGTISYGLKHTPPYPPNSSSEIKSYFRLYHCSIAGFSVEIHGDLDRVEAEEGLNGSGKG